MTSELPSSAEITRRLAVLEQLLRDLPRDLKETYLPRETYESDQRADGIVLRGIEAELHTVRADVKDLQARFDREKEHRDSEAATNRRLLFSAILAPIIVMIVGAILLGGVLQ